MFDGLSSASLGLALLALGAAIVNGMVGYGFSSIVTPIALIWLTSKVLNPALVLVELGVNATLLVKERQYLRSTFPRALPLIGGLLPGVLLGTFALSYLAPNGVKIIVYVTLLPLILFQLIGFRRPIQNERQVGVGLGSGIGFLYSLTTISGPPLALFWRNQGTSKGEFRCAMAQVRLAEASFTSLAYLAFGLFNPTSLSYLPLFVVPVIIGVPIGALLLRSVSRDFFSRIVMAADGMFVSFGLTNVLSQLKFFSMQTGLEIFLLATILLVALTAYVVRKVPMAPLPGRVPEEPGTARPLDSTT